MTLIQWLESIDSNANLISGSTLEYYTLILISIMETA